MKQKTEIEEIKERWKTKKNYQWETSKEQEYDKYNISGKKKVEENYTKESDAKKI